MMHLKMHHAALHDDRAPLLAPGRRAESWARGEPKAGLEQDQVSMILLPNPAVIIIPLPTPSTTGNRSCT